MLVELFRRQVESFRRQVEVTVDLTNAEAITTFSLQFGLTRPKQDSGRPADVVLDWLQLQYDRPVSLVDARG